MKYDKVTQKKIKKKLTILTKLEILKKSYLITLITV